jgi:hypothetical protein
MLDVLSDLHFQSSYRKHFAEAAVPMLLHLLALSDVSLAAWDGCTSGEILWFVATLMHSRLKHPDTRHDYTRGQELTRSLIRPSK